MYLPHNLRPYDLAWCYSTLFLPGIQIPASQLISYGNCRSISLVDLLGYRRIYSLGTRRQEHTLLVVFKYLENFYTSE